MEGVPSGVALLVVDVQHGYMKDETRHVPDAIRAYLDRHADEFQRVVATRFVNTRDSPLARLRDYDRMTGPPDTDLCDGIARPGVEVVTKSTYSALGEPDAQPLLDARTLYIAGLNTENCVLANAFAAFDRGIDPVVLASLCASSHGRNAHEAGLAVMRTVTGIRVLD